MYLHSIMGQEKAIKVLQNHLEAKRVYHTYLFYGPAGVGKTTTGRAFARALLCLEKGADACGKCNSCRKFTGSNHPDYSELVPQDDVLGIDMMREMRRSMVYRPYEGRYRIILIQQIEKLTEQAANSILKSLEEPPRYMVIILIANGRESLLPTILSRALSLAFEPLPKKIIGQKLQAMGADDDKVDIISSLAGGSIALAQNLLSDDDLLQKRSKLLEHLAKLERDSFLAVYEFVGLILEDWADYYDLLFYILHLWYNDLMSIRLKTGAGLYNKDFASKLKEGANHWDIADLPKIILAVRETKRQFDRPINKRLALETLFLKINSWRK